ncbi:excalibur calcium-binding domain-containing protein [Streptomyces sp. NPDC048685]|uniref:excalibur calcium-binding domain-containing protein n=1 Tax=Streptomyces sp. NPDC048685 TaxID=3365584 RepID=UPI0037112191
MSQSQQPPWGPPPPPPGSTPYGPSALPDRRPKWARKRIVIPAAVVLFLVGVGIGAADDPAATQKTAAAKAAPSATATVTATPAPSVTETVTASPEPAPTVTKTRTVRVTVPPAAEDDGSSGGSGSGGGSSSTYYANCTAVRAAGAAPIHAGEPGYGRHLDRDGDGVACE